MNNKCAFCDQLVAYFIRCEACGEAICPDHRTAIAMPGMLQPPVAVAGAAAAARPLFEAPPDPQQRFLCPNHCGVRAA